MDKRRLRIKEVAPSVSEVIVAMIAQSKGAPEALKWHYRTTMKLLIRNLERFVEPKVSKAAFERANSLGLPDLRTCAWRDQVDKMKDRGRKIFHWEHVVQVSDLTNDILNLSNATVTEITSLLETSQVAWILKIENDRLRKGRRPDPAKAYAEAGISFV